MDLMWVLLIIVLVLGVVVGNITLLKYSAKFKFPTPTKPYNAPKNNADPQGKSDNKTSSNGFDDEDDW